MRDKNDTLMDYYHELSGVGAEFDISLTVRECIHQINNTRSKLKDVVNNAVYLRTQFEVDLAMAVVEHNVNTSGKAGAQIPHLPLGDDSSPLGEMMHYVCKLTRFTRLSVTSHSQPLINAKHKFQVTNYLQTIF
jgi:hypothetical protein